MDIRGKKFLLIGGAGLIGSHTADELLKEDVAEIRIYDNFTRGSKENLGEALKDPRVNIFGLGGELMHRDILDAAKIRKFFEMGCEVKGLGRGHVKRIKDEVRTQI